MSFSSWNCWDAKFQASDDFLNASNVHVSIGYLYSLPDAVTTVEAAADPEPGRGGRGCPHHLFVHLESTANIRIELWLGLLASSSVGVHSSAHWLVFFLFNFFSCLSFLFICFRLPPPPPFFVICNDVLAQLTFDLHFLINICNSFLKKGIFSWLGSW